MARPTSRLLAGVLVLGAAFIILQEPARAAPDPTTVCVVVERARVRTCPSLDCATIKIKSRNDLIGSLAITAGQPVGGDPLWHEVEVLNSPTPGYMHASVLGPCPAPPAAPAPPDSDRLTPDVLTPDVLTPDVLTPEEERIAHGATVRLVLARGDGTAVQGTGTVIGRDGLTLLTAFHVVGNPYTGRLYGGTLRVGPYLDWTLEAEFLAGDPTVDMALLRVRYPRGLFSVVPMGDSDLLERGDVIYLLSYPSQGAGSLVRSAGTVLGRFPFAGYAVPLLATDALASPGSSGGVAINARGEVVGIVTGLVVSPAAMARLGRPNLPAATLLVPINAAQPLLDSGVDRSAALDRQLVPGTLR